MEEATTNFSYQVLMENYNKCVVGNVEPKLLLINPKDWPSLEKYLGKIVLKTLGDNAYTFCGAIIRSHPYVPVGEIYTMGGIPILSVGKL